MKNKLAETKLNSAPGMIGRLFGQVIALGAIILICSSASAQDHSIQGFVKGTDGKGAAQAQVKIVRLDGKGRLITATTDAKGNYAVNGVPVGSFKVTAAGKDVMKEVDGINTKSGNSVTVNFDFGKAAIKGERRWIWVKGQTGSMIPGQWKEDKVLGSQGSGEHQVENVDRDSARKAFEDSHGHLDPAK
jgi:hypothetical protein